MGASIEIWTAVSGPEVKSALPPLGRARVEVSQVDVSVLAENLNTFLAAMQSVLDLPEQNQSSYSIEEIELSLGVNASGGIAMVGKLEAGAEAGIKVTLKKRGT